MAGSDCLIYGANGYAGRLAVEQAVSRGLSPIVAGRNDAAIRAVAAAFGLRHRIFALDDARAARSGLEGVGTLLLAAGPFSATSAPALDACLATRTHYLDLTGEIAVFEAAQARDADAKQAGIVVLPGVGFDVVPSDCLAAALHRALPDARRLELAISVVGKPGPGSLKTAVEGAAQSVVRRDGELVTVPAAWHVRRVPFPDGAQWAMTIPWGDVSTAYRSTGIPDIEVLMAAPRAATWLVRRGRPLLRGLENQRVRRGIDFAITKLVSGTDAAGRSAGRSSVWGRVEDAASKSVEGTVTTVETTTITARTSVDIAIRVQSGEVAAGYATPSLAFGPGYIETFPDTRMRIGPQA